MQLITVDEDVLGQPPEVRVNKVLLYWKIKIAYFVFAPVVLETLLVVQQ